MATIRLAGPLRLLALALLVSTASAGDLRTERVFGPEVTTGPYKHPASLAELANGDLYLVYYGGQGEYATDTSVFGARKAAGQDGWSTPVVIAHDPFRSVGNAVVWEAPDGLVWLFYVVRYGDTWATSRIQFKVSRDGARTWSDASVLSQEEGMMVRGRPIVLADGQYLLPIYHESGADTESVGPGSTSRFLRFDPKTKQWSTAGVIRSPRGNIQPAVVELDPGHLVAYCRRGGGYGKDERGFVVRAESRDGGQTWSEGRDTEFKNPNAAVDLIRLRNGHLLLVFNDCFHGRSPLTLALSEDGDRSYPFRRNLADAAGGDFAYPVAFQAKDGTIHVVYTSDRRQVIQHATFDESWVRDGR